MERHPDYPPGSNRYSGGHEAEDRVAANMGATRASFNKCEGNLHTVTTERPMGADVRFASAEVRYGRVIAGRLLPGTELIGGIEAVCDQHGLRFAAIMSAYGSLARAAFRTLQVKSQSDFRPTLERVDLDKRVEFLAGQGLVCEDGKGFRATHLHGAIADETGALQGGHFEPEGNSIYNNLDFVIVELLGAILLREWDQETSTVEMRLLPDRVELHD